MVWCCAHRSDSTDRKSGRSGSLHREPEHNAQTPQFCQKGFRSSLFMILPVPEIGSGWTRISTEQIKSPLTGAFYLAVREGFEPSIPVRVYSLSRGAPSATRPPHQKLMSSKTQVAQNKTRFDPIRVTGRGTQTNPHTGYLTDSSFGTVHFAFKIALSRLRPAP